MLRSKNVRQCFRQYMCRYVRCFYIIMYVCLLCVNHVCQYACLNVRQYLRQYECQCLFQRSGVGTMRTEISIRSSLFGPGSEVSVGARLLFKRFGRVFLTELSRAAKNIC